MNLTYTALAIVSGLILLGVLSLNYYEGNKVQKSEPEQVQPTENIPNKEDDVVKTPITSEDTLPKPQANVTLDLSGKGLREVPAYVFTQKNIEALDLSNNALHGALQAEVRQLSQLRVLDLSDNNFTGVPAEVGALTHLEVLDLSNNQLTGLPYEIGNLKNLKKLDVSGNAYAEADLEHIRSNLPATTVIITK